MRSIIITVLLLIANLGFGQDSFKLFNEKEIPEIGKNVQVGRVIPEGFEIFYHPKEYKYYLKEIGSKENDALEPAYIIIRMVDINGNITEDINTYYNGNDTDYFFPRKYLIGDNKYLIVKRRFASFMIDIDENKVVPGYRTKQRDNVEIEDVADASQGELFFFDKDYLIYRQGGLGIFCINYKDKNNPKELDNYYFWSYRSPFFFIDSLGENKYSGIFSTGRQDNTKYLFENENLKSVDGKLVSIVKEKRFLILQTDKNEYIIIDFKDGKLLSGDENKDLIDRLITKH